MALALVRTNRGTVDFSKYMISGTGEDNEIMWELPLYVLASAIILLLYLIPIIHPRTSLVPIPCCSGHKTILTHVYLSIYLSLYIYIYMYLHIPLGNQSLEVGGLISLGEKPV